MPLSGCDALQPSQAALPPPEMQDVSHAGEFYRAYRSDPMTFAALVCSLRLVLSPAARGRNDVARGRLSFVRAQFGREGMVEPDGFEPPTKGL